MTELHWPPDVVGRLTVAQLACIGSDRPPGDAGPARSFDQMAARLAAQAAEDAAWRGESVESSSPHR